MKTRWFRSLLAVMIACVTFVGCEKAQLEPEPSPEGSLAEPSTDLTQEIGADAAAEQHDEPAAKKE